METYAARWNELGHPYPGAYATWREAEALLARRHRSARAAEALRAAHEVAVSLGAEPLRRQVEALARRGRVPLSPSEPPPAPPGPGNALAAGPVGRASPLSSLTRRELQVLRLVAEGRSNRQVAVELFISEKTASLHVSHILAKLGVTSRGQAGAVAHRLGLVGSP